MQGISVCLNEHMRTHKKGKESRDSLRSKEQGSKEAHKEQTHQTTKLADPLRHSQAHSRTHVGVKTTKMATGYNHFTAPPPPPYTPHAGPPPLPTPLYDPPKGAPQVPVSAPSCVPVPTYESRVQSSLPIFSTVMRPLQTRHPGSRFILHQRPDGGTMVTVTGQSQQEADTAARDLRTCIDTVRSNAAYSTIIYTAEEYGKSPALNAFCYSQQVALFAAAEAAQLPIFFASALHQSLRAPSARVLQGYHAHVLYSFVPIYTRETVLPSNHPPFDLMKKSLRKSADFVKYELINSIPTWHLNALKELNLAQDLSATILFNKSSIQIAALQYSELQALKLKLESAVSRLVQSPEWVFPLPVANGLSPQVLLETLLEETLDRFHATESVEQSWCTASTARDGLCTCAVTLLLSEQNAGYISPFADITAQLESIARVGLHRWSIPKSVLKPTAPKAKPTPSGQYFPATKPFDRLFSKQETSTTAMPDLPEGLATVLPDGATIGAYRDIDLPVVVMETIFTAKMKKANLHAISIPACNRFWKEWKSVLPKQSNVSAKVNGRGPSTALVLHGPASSVQAIVQFLVGVPGAPYAPKGLLQQWCEAANTVSFDLADYLGPIHRSFSSDIRNIVEENCPHASWRILENNAHTVKGVVRRAKRNLPPRGSRTQFFHIEVRPGRLVRDLDADVLIQAYTPAPGTPSDVEKAIGKGGVPVASQMEYGQPLVVGNIPDFTSTSAVIPWEPISKTQLVATYMDVLTKAIAIKPEATVIAMTLLGVKNETATPAESMDALWTALKQSTMTDKNLRVRVTELSHTTIEAFLPTYDALIASDATFKVLASTALPPVKPTPVQPPSPQYQASYSANGQWMRFPGDLERLVIEKYEQYTSMPQQCFELLHGADKYELFFGKNPPVFVKNRGCADETTQYMLLHPQQAQQPQEQGLARLGSLVPTAHLDGRGKSHFRLLINHFTDHTSKSKARQTLQQVSDFLSSKVETEEVLCAGLDQSVVEANTDDVAASFQMRHDYLHFELMGDRVTISGKQELVRQAASDLRQQFQEV
eukprot:m.54436 g.54436  ORF g.54436 m.54436 type:complete len:1052 (+) comp11416_c1_seq2:698-3853(+)